MTRSQELSNCGGRREMNVGRCPNQLLAWGLLSTPVQYAARLATIATRSTGSRGRRRDERFKKKLVRRVSWRLGVTTMVSGKILGNFGFGAIERSGNARNIYVLTVIGYCISNPVCRAFIRSYLVPITDRSAAEVFPSDQG